MQKKGEKIKSTSTFGITYVHSREKDFVTVPFSRCHFLLLFVNSSQSESSHSNGEWMRNFISWNSFRFRIGNPNRRNRNASFVIFLVHVSHHSALADTLRTRRHKVIQLKYSIKLSQVNLETDTKQSACRIVYCSFNVSHNVDTSPHVRMFHCICIHALSCVSRW